MKYLEENVPESLRVHIVYLHEGNSSRSKLKKIGKTNTTYVTLAKLISKDTDITLAEGMASCSPMENPRRATGRQVAIGRALHNYFNGERAHG